MQLFVSYCTIATIAGIVLNAIFIIVSNLSRVEGFQEVFIFSRSISVVYILLALVILAVMPRSVTVGSSNIHISYGLLAQAEPPALMATSSLGVGCLLYAMLCFCVMFLYRYKVTYKTNNLSTLFGRKNIKIFLGAAALLSVIEATMVSYAQVDSNYLLLRLNASNWTRDAQMRVVDVGNGILTLHTGSSDTMLGNFTNTQLKYSADGQQPTRGVGQGKPLSVFGTDFTRNPMFFLAAGVMAVSSVTCSLIVLVVSVIIAYKLRGRQENMSDKSQGEHQWLMLVLILKAYAPIVLLALTAANYFVCAIRNESLLFQQYTGTVLLSAVPLTLPLVNLMFVPELRNTALQLLVCVYWRNRARETKSAQQNNNKNAEELNASQRQMVDNLLAKG